MNEAGKSGAMSLVTAGDAANLLAPFFAHEPNHERLICVHLDASGGVLAVEEVGCGGLHSAPVPLRQIIARALSVEAAGLILAHNHPSGDAAPSREDVAATRRLAEVGQALGLRLHDHLIFAGGSCQSFRASGLL